MNNREGHVWTGNRQVGGVRSLLLLEPVGTRKDTVSLVSGNKSICLQSESRHYGIITVKRCSLINNKSEKNLASQQYEYGMYGTLCPLSIPRASHE